MINRKSLLKIGNCLCSLSQVIVAVIVFSTTNVGHAEQIPMFEDVKNPFQRIGVDNIDSLIVFRLSGQLNGMDQLIIASGSTDASNREKILLSLKASGFQELQEMEFVSGPDEAWQKVDGVVGSVINLERFVSSQDQIKIYEMKSKTLEIRLQSTGY